MSLIDIVKETAGTVLEAISENPVVAAGVAVGAVAVTGGGLWFNKRRKAKKATAAAIAEKKAADTAAAIAEGKLVLTEAPPINAEHSAAQAAVVKLNEQHGGVIPGAAKG